MAKSGWRGKLIRRSEVGSGGGQPSGLRSAMRVDFRCDVDEAFALVRRLRVRGAN